MNLLWLPPPDISATKGHFRVAEHDITPISTARYCAAIPSEGSIRANSPALRNQR